MERQRAVLVLDMPKRCDDCWLANFEKADCYCYCMALQKPVDYDDPNYEEMDTEGGDWRWDKCPLKELPESYELPDWITEDDIDHYSGDREQEVAYFLGYYDGWNECLGEIEGEEN